MTLPSNTQEHRLTLQATVTPAGKFEILAITAGVGNGWTFPAEALKASLSLWDRVECFVDHDYFGHSLKDLAGVLHSPAWDEARKGIRAQLRTAGPSGPLLDALGREMLADEDPKPDVGFSADVLFTAKGKVVETILRVLSCDLVFDPARGGAFLRALNSARAPMPTSLNSKKGDTMSDPTKGQAPAPAPSVTREAVTPSVVNDVEAMLAAQRQQLEANALQDEIAAAQRARLQLCGYMLDAALLASRLPASLQSRVRTQFSGKAFEPADLTRAIDDARSLLGELGAGAVVQGPTGQIHAMYSETDRLSAATDDLLGAPRDERLKSLKIRPLSGIRELYLMLTGDHEMHGHYNADRVQLATTADFSGLVKNALNKIVAEHWDALGRAGYDWWQNIVTVEHFTSLNGITGTLVGTVGTLPTIAEGGEYTELAVGDSPETATFVKYGGYIPLTLELIDRDNAKKLSSYARELANAGIRRISALVAAIFTDASGTGPTLADGAVLFNNTAVTSSGGHANLLVAALSAAQWETVAAAMYNQPMLIKNATGYYGTGPKMAVDPRYCLVPRALGKTARDLFLNQWDITDNKHAENLLKGLVVPLIVPEWTDTTDWAAVADPAIAPAIYVGERFGLLPEIFVAGDSLSPAVFMNDETRLKVRLFCAVWVNDFRPLHKENV